METTHRFGSDTTYAQSGTRFNIHTFRGPYGTLPDIRDKMRKIYIYTGSSELYAVTGC